MDAVAGLAFNPESLRPIASGQHPSLITKHNQSPVILLDAGLLDRSRNLEVGVPIKDLAITALLSDLGPERGLVPAALDLLGADHGQGNLPRGHKRTTSTKATAKIKTTVAPLAKLRSTGMYAFEVGA